MASIHHTLPYQWTHATCIECGYHGPLSDFAAKHFVRQDMPPVHRGERHESYVAEVGDVCTICWAKQRPPSEEITP